MMRAAGSGRLFGPVRQQGQALPLALLLAAAGIAAWLYNQGVGSTAAARLRLTHAADATAYSGAVVQARSLNLLATIQRAQIAHQVGLAHLASLAAWAQHGQAQRQRVARGNPPAYLIGMLFGGIYGSAYGASRSVSPGAVGAIAQAQVEHERLINDVLDVARRAIVQDMPRARQQAMLEVLAANFPELPASQVQMLTPTMSAINPPALSMQLTGDTLPGFVVNHAPSARGSLRDAVDAAVLPYGFLRPRQRTVRNPWSVSKQCPLLRHELRRRGQTRMDAAGRWRAHDTLSYHALRSNRKVGCYFREYPMGWGLMRSSDSSDTSLVHHDAPPEDFSGQDFWRWVRDATDWGLLDGSDNFLANSYAVMRGARWSSSGLPGLSALAERGDATQSLRFRIQLRQRVDSVRLPGLAGSRVGSGLANDALLAPDAAITVDAAAHTYFLRPQARQDGRLEQPNLFHPYWQPALLSAERS